MTHNGARLIKQAQVNLPQSPGIYKMIGEDKKTLYIGKARNLKKRVQSYTKPERQSARIQRMIAATQSLEFITTHTEAEALLLEANLIKKLKPRYNILMRDDKSYPMILIRTDHPFPQVIKYRGSQKNKGEYFGPFASTQAVNETIAILQKAFLLRNCSDWFFKNRSRPCLQYHIKRCCGPCVNKINTDSYAELVNSARAFLQGKSRQIQDNLAKAMQDAGEALNFEEAAQIRDRIKALNSVQSHQDVNVANISDADIIAIARRDTVCCIQIFFYRGGRNYGCRNYFPAHIKEQLDSEILSAFIAQFYTDKPPPPLILCTRMPTQADWLKQALSEKATRRIQLTSPQRGSRKRLCDFALARTQSSLSTRIADNIQQQKLLEKLGTLLNMQETPETIEVYDNSHLQGSHSVGVMIAVDTQGFAKKRYRKFNIKTTQKGDDYAMMREIIKRRFKRTINQKASDSSAWELPDLIVLDGGKGQLSAAFDALKALDIKTQTIFIAVAKGEIRNKGGEVLHCANGSQIRLADDDPLQFFIQRIRDESHRFAIGTHRQKRGKQALKSQLDEIHGVGRLRRRKLLLHFGSMEAVASAGIEDLSKVNGLSKNIAEKIYNFFHAEN